MSIKLFTTPEAATLIGYSAGRLRQLIATGKAQPRKQVGGTWMFSQKEIERLCRRRKVKTG